MPKNNIKKSSTIIAGWLIISLLSLFSIYYFYQFFEPTTKFEVFNISDQWISYHENEKQELFLTRLNTVKRVSANQVIRLERVLTEKSVSPTVMLSSINQWMRLSLDDQLIFETLENDETGLHMIPLPPDYIGHTLLLEVSSPYETYAGVLRPIYFGSTISLCAKIISESLFHLLFMVCCLISGFFFMLCSMWVAQQSHPCSDYFFLGYSPHC